MQTRNIIFTFLFLTGTTACANVIFPAFSAPYITVVIFPVALIATLGIELLAYQRLCKTLAFKAIFMLVLATNIVSWFVGNLIANFLPSGLAESEQGYVTSGPNFDSYVVLAFPVAYILSVVIEGAILSLAAKRFNISSPYRLSFIANTLSYLLLSAMVFFLR